MHGRGKPHRGCNIMFIAPERTQSLATVGDRFEQLGELGVRIGICV